MFICSYTKNYVFMFITKNLLLKYIAELFLPTLWNFNLVDSFSRDMTLSFCLF